MNVRGNHGIRKEGMTTNAETQLSVGFHVMALCNIAAIVSRVPDVSADTFVAAFALYLTQQYGCSWQYCIAMGVTTTK